MSILFCQKSVFSEPTIGGIIAQDFLKKMLIKFYALEKIRMMNYDSGSRCINKAFKKASEEVNNIHRKHQNKIIKKYERKLMGKDLTHPNKKTRPIIKKYNWEMGYIDNVRIRNLQKLENQRKNLINFFKDYWFQNMKKQKQRTM